MKMFLIHVKTSRQKVEASGILGVMFDVNAVKLLTLTGELLHYNAKEFYTNYYKADAGYYNDLNENFLVFFVQETQLRKQGVIPCFLIKEAK